MVEDEVSELLSFPCGTSRVLSSSPHGSLRMLSSSPHGISRVLSSSSMGPQECYLHPPWDLMGVLIPHGASQVLSLPPPTPQYLLGTLILLHRTSRAILVVLLCRSRLVCHPAGDTGHYPWCRRGHFLLLGELCSSYIDSSGKLE